MAGCADMLASRGMGIIAKSKMPSGIRKSRFASGGKLPAAFIDGDEFVMAAKRYGLNDLDEAIDDFDTYAACMESWNYDPPDGFCE